MKNKRAQINIVQAGVAVLGVIILFFMLGLITTVLSSVTSGNIDNSLNALVNAFIPLIVFAIFFEFIRRIFG